MMNAIVDVSNDIPTKFVIEKAIPADKKAYPKKMIIVLVSTIASFILGVIVLLTIDKIKECLTAKLGISYRNNAKIMMNQVHFGK